MKKITILLLLLSMTSPMLGAVFTRVCEADGKTPFDGRDIMVGTKLTLIVWSDESEPWGDYGGGLAIEEQYWDYGILSARGPQVGEDWTGSHFPAAGNEAVVWVWEESEIDGFFLYPGATDIEAGDWFIIDYNALDVGSCIVDFYDFNIDEFEPVDSFTFHHVRTRLQQ